MNINETVSLPPRLLRTRQVAEMLGCSRNRVHQLARDGVLVPVRLVPLGDLRFRIEDVEQLIAGELMEAVPQIRGKPPEAA